MRLQFITNHHNERLLLIFAGWGMDTRPFNGLQRSGYDVAVAYDYTGFDSKKSAAVVEKIAKEHVETVVVAWSFGVRAAQEILSILSEAEVSITRTVAINGTPMHIDDHLGIPTGIFSGTLAGLSERSVEKFYRRMFGSSADYAAFVPYKPDRTLQSLHDELVTFGMLPPIPVEHSLWDIALISDSDRIFPTANQQEAWREVDSDIMTEGSHFPDFQSIINRYIVDKGLVARRFSSAADTYADGATVQTLVAGKLWQLCKVHMDESSCDRSLNVLEVGYGNGTLTEMYVRELPHMHLTLWDIASLPVPPCAPSDVEVRCCDAETAIREVPQGGLDLFISASTIQWFHSPERFVANVAATLSPGGMAALSLYGKGTYAEVESATGHTLAYPPMDCLAKAATDCGLSILECREEVEVVEFDSVSQLSTHLKQTGVNALESDPEAAKHAAIKLMRHYPLTPSGTAPLTYRPIYLLLRKPATIS